MPTTENPYAGQGPVPLDIGGDVGALVVTMPEHRPDLDDLEVEIRPAGAVADHPHHDHDHEAGHHHHASPFPHVGVVPRPTPSGTVSCLVYPALLAGDYELYPVGTHGVTMTATVVGGEVTELDWPA